MRGTWTTIDVDGSAMETYVATPDGPGPFPAVVVAMHVFGIGDFVGGKCDELADAGYVAVAPYLFHRSSVSNAELAGISATDPKRFEVGLPLKDQLTDADIERDMLEALAHARSMPQVGATAGITGFCIGGRIAYLLAAKTEEFGACAVFYGTDIAEAWGDGPTPLSLTPYLDCALAGFFGTLNVTAYMLGTLAVSWASSKLSLVQLMEAIRKARLRLYTLPPGPGSKPPRGRWGVIRRRAKLSSASQTPGARWNEIPSSRHLPVPGRTRHRRQPRLHTPPDPPVGRPGRPRGPLLGMLALGIRRCRIPRHLAPGLGLPGHGHRSNPAGGP